MYGLCLCGVCRKPRIADKSQMTSTCPYCNSSEKTKDLIFYYEHRNQDVVRMALSQATGFVPPDVDDKKERIRKVDPYSSMVYKYEHTSDLDEKMEVLAKGLTEVYGTFTMDDVEAVVGARAEKMVAAMLDRCIISEVRHGRYRA